MIRIASQDGIYVCSFMAFHWLERKASDPGGRIGGYRPKQPIWRLERGEVDVSATLDVQYVVLELGEEKYALRIYDIFEVIKMQKITEVPNSKPYILGVINLRGKIVPIISLRRRFGFTDAPVTKSTRIVVVQIREEIVGIVVDGVHKVTTFTDIQPPSEIVSGIDGNYIEGIGQTEEGLVSILNIHQVLFE